MEKNSKESGAGPESVERITLPIAGGEPDPKATLGHFVIGKRLGGGGMGVVFEARDTDLDRTVALKLLRPGSTGERARARLLREAQALARLRHPNVVTVFEVGTSGAEIFIAMELIGGGTLQDWMGKAHGWREVVDLFIGIGKGLAAAHALGLIHRDIKPANVFIESDGTPKIGDFGLVSSSGAEGDEDEPGSPPSDARSPLETNMTTAGRLMGTPAYMSPEQTQGQRADARADQFAYCISLLQALTGTLPDQIKKGRPVPKALRNILARGLDARVEARYPSMELLLADLSRARRDRSRQWITLAAALVIGAGVWALARSSAAEPCPPPTARLEAIWGEARRASVREHLLSIDKTQGAARLAAVDARMGPFVSAFRGMQVEACRATRVNGTQSDTLLDLRMRCLERRAVETEDGVAVLASAPDVPAIDRAVAGLMQLSPLDECADTASLARATPLPEQPAARATAEQLLRRIDAISARERGGSLAGLPAIARGVVDEARALGDAPVLAAALVALAKVQLAVYDESAAGTTLREATQVAARAHDDRSEAFAWTELVGALGFTEGKPEQAMALVPAANAAVLRAGAPVDLKSDLLYEQGFVLAEGPHPEEGLKKQEEARALLEGAGATAAGSPLAPRLGEVYLATGAAKQRTGDEAGAVAGYRRAIALFQQVYGPDSLDEALGWHDLCETQRQFRKLDDALVSCRNAVRIRESRLGPSPGLASSLASLATTLSDQGHWREGLDTYEQAIRIQNALLPEGDTQRVPEMLGRARALVHLGRRDEAALGYDATIALMEHAGLRTANLGITLFNRGELDRERGHCAEGLSSYAASIALFEEVRGKDASILGYPLVGEARCLLDLGRPAEALAPLERAARVSAGNASLGALNRFFRARAQIESGQGRAQGLADAKPARDAVAASGPDPDDLQDIDRWMAKH